MNVEEAIDGVPRKLARYDVQPTVSTDTWRETLQLETIVWAELVLQVAHAVAVAVDDTVEGEDA